MLRASYMCQPPTLKTGGPLRRMLARRNCAPARGNGAWRAVRGLAGALVA